jgi:uncharacterized iron-regulated membrane protein
MTFVYPVIFLFLTILVTWWKRRAVARTAYNRWVVTMILVALTGQILVLSGGALMGRHLA